MRKYLIRKFVKNHTDTRSPKVREAYGKLAGTVGIVTNGMVCIMKIITGMISGSIAVIADGINNLADASSSIVTLAGFKLAGKREDAKHPYGHGRFEYLAGLFVSIIIIIVGVQLLISSAGKIIEPATVEFDYVTVIILVVSIAIKIWQTLFNVYIGKTINSGALKATAVDSRNDCIATCAVLISLFIGEYAGINVDGYMGALVALFIVYSGIQSVRETIDPLLGQPPSAELVKEIEDIIEGSPASIGMHDLVIHDYGPGRIFASVHVEIDGRENIFISHDDIDNIEKKVLHELGVELVIHMDPVDREDPSLKKLDDFLRNAIGPHDQIESMHDLRIVPGHTHVNILFDLVMKPGYDYNEKDIENELDKKLKKIDPKYNAVITFDIDLLV